jgi:chromosome segregation ATPase
MRLSLKYVPASLLAAGLMLASPLASSTSFAAPVAKNTALIDARKKVDEANKVVLDIKKEKDRIHDKKRTEFEAKDEWKDTASNQKKAKAAFESAKKQALATLQAKPEYKQLLKDRDALQAQQTEVEKGGDSAAITKVGSELSAKNTTIKNLEKDAMEQDEKASSAKEKMDKADQAMKDLDAEVDSALATDPDFLQVEEQSKQAEQALTQAKDAYTQMQKSEQQQRSAASKAASEANKAKSKSKSSGSSSSKRRSGGSY